MKKLIYIVIISILSANVQAADTELQDLAELVAIASTDVFYVVDDPAGTPASKKITALNIFDMIDTSAELLNILTNETGTGALVFATSPTLVTPILGTITSGVGTALTALDGENIQNDTIDDDSIDWADCTFADFDFETAWKMWHSDAAGDVTEITLGANGTFLESNGAAANPAFRALLAADIPDISATYQPLDATLTDIADGTIAENLVNTANPWADNEVADNITIDLATLATTVTVSDDEATDDDQEVVFTTDNTNLESDGNFHYSPDTGTVTATEFVGGGAGLTALNGENISNDTIDNDSIDWGDMTDLDTDGAVIWGNIAEGELANSSVIGADIKDDTVDSDDYAGGSIDDEHIADDSLQEPALNATNAGGAGIDNYVLSYNHAGTNFTWVVAGAGDMLKATYDSGISGGVDVLTTVDSTYASDYVLLTGTAVGTAAPKTDGGLTYDATSGTLSSTVLTEGGTAVWNSGETDILDSGHYIAASIDYEHLATDVITGAAAVGAFESGDTFLVMEAGVGLREADYDDLPGVSTAWDDIGDPDAAATVDFVTYTQTIDIGVTDTGGPKSGLILDVTGLGAGATDVIALEITTATNDDSDYVPIAVYDDSGVDNDLLFSINYLGGIYVNDDINLDEGQIIDGTTNNYISFVENSDKIEFYYGGTDLDIEWTDGALNLRNKEDGVDAIVEIEGKDAGEKGILRVLSDGDDNYIELHHDDTDGHIITDTGDIHIEAAGGDISFADENLVTTGAVDFGGAVSVEITNSADPDVDAVGEISIDSDGANEPNDVVLRSIDGGNTPLQIALAQQQKSFQATIIKPNDLADATRDACLIWSNETGMSFVVTKIEAWSDTDDTTLNVEEEDGDGANNATVDAVEIATNGTGMYYTTETTITANTVEANHLILLDFDDTDDPGWVKVSICGYFLSDVN